LTALSDFSSNSFMKDDPLDSLGRRKRFSKRADDGVRFEPTEREYIAMQRLDEFGPLPWPYLYEFTKHFARDYTYCGKRFSWASFRANTPDKGIYFFRPPQQEETRHADEQPLCYDNTDIARKALVSMGKRLYPKRFDHMHHRFMNACVTASVAIAAKEAGLGFVSLPEILNKPGCKATNAKNPLSLKLRHGELVPDDLNAVVYPKDGKRLFRFIAWEQDRATETLDAIEFKFKCYLETLRSGEHSAYWGIPNLTVAFVTTERNRMYNMIKRLEELTEPTPHLRKHFIFKYKPLFNGVWTTPPVMRDLLTDPWERAGKPFDLRNPAEH